MSGLAADFADANSSALSNFFLEKFNLVGRDSEYDISRPTLRYLPKDTEKLKSAEGFYEALKIAKANAGGPGWGAGNTYHFTNSSVRWHVEKPYAQYARMTFDNLMLARTPTATLLDLQESESEDVKDNMLNTLEFEIWNDGSGLRGQIDVLGGSEPTRVLTLKDPSTVYNFQHNAVITGAAAADGSTPHGDRYRITDLLPEQGQIIAVQLTNTGGQELADEDYLFYYNAAANYMPGIPTFIPSSDPSDTLFNVVRTGDPAKSGWRFGFKNSMSYTIQYAFAQMGRWIKREGKSYVAVVSTMDWLALSQEREGRVMEEPGAMQQWGLEGLAVRTPFGKITVIAIPQVADGRGYIIDWSSWTLYTLGNLPHVVMSDGKVFQRLGIDDPAANAHPVVDGDGVEMRLRIWKVLLCRRPMSNATFATR